MSERNTKNWQIVIGTSGHIDHGKTSLVLALTGTNTDRLAEEKARGMTIDLGFAFLNDQITIIDVPGHEKFIRNMVAGVATIDMALLIIAADDGIMPQTREHVHIMDLLGVKTGIIALTKTDLVEDKDWLDLVEDDIRQTLANTFLSDAPIIRTSISTTEGIETLRDTILNMAESCKYHSDRGYFRLPVDRVFTKSGFGSVVTGTVISGQISVGDMVEIQPGDIVTKVRGLQSHGEKTDTVSMGDRAAINLLGVDKADMSRGTEISSPERLACTSSFIGYTTLLSATSWKLKNRQRIRLHTGTTEILGRVQMATPMLESGQSDNVYFHMEECLPLTMDDRFIIRSYSPMETIGGGIILYPSPEEKPQEMKALLDEIPENWEKRFMWFVHNRWTKPMTKDEWSRFMQQPMDKIEDCVKKYDLQTLTQSKELYHEDDLEKGKNYICDSLKTFHSVHPYRPYLGRKQLLDTSGIKPTYFEYIISILSMEKRIVQIESGLALSDHTIELTKEDSKISNVLKTALHENGFEPVPSKSLAVTSGKNIGHTQELLHVMKGHGDIQEILEGWWMTTFNYQKLVSSLQEWFSEHDTLSVTDFKDMTGLTRKTAIPLLEFLDKTGITIRGEKDRKSGEKLLDEANG